MSAPSPRDRCIAQRERSKVIRFAGFRRLHPIVPDRAAFGAAVEDETHRDNTENNRQSPAHGLPRAPAPIIRGQSGRFQATLADAENASRPSSPEFRDDRHLIAPETLPIVARCVGAIVASGADLGTIVMQSGQDAAEFDLDEAKRVLLDVFAPWVQDLGLSVESIEIVAPPGASAGWQPGAVLRMGFSDRLCRHGGVVCGQALMALADTAMVIAILAANRGFRPMTTVDQTTHFLKAVTSSDVLADARVVRLGRTMSFGRVTLSSAADNKPVAMVSSAFAML
jgi:uncharacterized protein (TIGR00369 family)